MPSCLTFSAAGQLGSIEISERGKGRHMADVVLTEKAKCSKQKVGADSMIDRVIHDSAVMAL